MLRSCDVIENLADDDSQLPSTEGCTRSNHHQKHHHMDGEPTTHIVTAQMMLSMGSAHLREKPSKEVFISTSSPPSQPSLDRYQHTMDHRKSNQILQPNTASHHPSYHHYHHVTTHLVWEYVEKGVSFRDEAAV